MEAPLSDGGAHLSTAVRLRTSVALGAMWPSWMNSPPPLVFTAPVALSVQFTSCELCQLIALPPADAACGAVVPSFRPRWKVQAVPTWAKSQGFADNADAVAGAKVFASSGCTACHTYLGTGSSNLGAPDLTAIGKNGQGPDFFSKYVADPSKYGNNVMPKFGSLGQQKLQQLGVFLSASKGPK